MYSRGRGSCILLRADMDALPITEDSGEPFACTNGTMHACGHDMHTAMLLGAARLLKEWEKELRGTVKFMFQPAEEILSGAQAMIDAGIMESPRVDAAMAMHVGVGGPNPDRKVGAIRYAVGESSHSADQFYIKVQVPSGVRGINPLSISSRIVLGLQDIMIIEFPAHEMVDIKCGVMKVGKVANTPAEFGVIEGVARAARMDTRDKIKARIEEISKSIASGFHASAEVTWVRGVPPMYNDPALCEELSAYIEEVVGPEKMFKVSASGGGEDFSAVSRMVPSMFFDIGCGNWEDGYMYPNHNPKFRLSEDALPIGAAIHTTCAFNWLMRHCSDRK